MKNILTLESARQLSVDELDKALYSSVIQLSDNNLVDIAGNVEFSYGRRMTSPAGNSSRFRWLTVKMFKQVINGQLDASKLNFTDIEETILTTKYTEPLIGEYLRSLPYPQFIDLCKHDIRLLDGSIPVDSKYHDSAADLYIGVYDGNLPDRILFTDYIKEYYSRGRVF